MPSPGTIRQFHAAGGPGVRVDSHVYSNYVVPPHYDSMIGKIITHGVDRSDALRRMHAALQEMVVDGIKTNIPLHRRLVRDRGSSRAGATSTIWRKCRVMGEFIEYQITVPAAQAAAVSDCFEELGALSVTLSGAGDEVLCDAAAPTMPTMPTWAVQHITALFTNNSDAPAGGLTPRLRARLSGAVGGAPELRASALKDCDWERRWRAGLRPSKVGPRLWICPGAGAPPEPDATSIVIEPGMAFGTGSHATTRLCLEWLAEAELRRRSVLDFGCGTGVLGIAAVKLGARSATGVDIDARAVGIARDNARRNGVADRFRACASEQFTAQCAASGAARFDIVMANILAGALLDLQDTLTGFCDDGGWLLLSGMLVSQAAAVEQAFAGRRFERRQLDGWALLSAPGR